MGNTGALVFLQRTEPILSLVYDAIVDTVANAFLYDVCLIVLEVPVCEIFILRPFVVYQAATDL